MTASAPFALRRPGGPAAVRRPGPQPPGSGRQPAALAALAAAAALALQAPAAAVAQEAGPPVEHISSELTAGAEDLPFTEIVRVGDILYLSGMMGIRPGTVELVPGGMEAEARQALENIRTMLRAAGATMEDVVKCTVMLDDIGQWSAFNEVYVQFFRGRRPARSAFGADGLALGGAVEIECIAVAPPGGAAGAP